MSCLSLVMKGPSAIDISQALERPYRSAIGNLVSVQNYDNYPRITFKSGEIRKRKKKA